MGLEIQVNSLEEMCDLMCGMPEEVRMNTYIIEYRHRADEYAEHYRYYVEAFDADDAVKRFRSLSSKQESMITEVARVMKKDYSKM